jgi:DnaK suppressor protein
MNLDHAQALIAAERDRVKSLLRAATDAHNEDTDAEREAGHGDADSAQPLEHEAVDLAIERSLLGRLAALDRAQQRIADGVYGLSIESGSPIPDERLEVDPAAELTVEEAARHQHHDY